MKDGTHTTCVGSAGVNQELDHLGRAFRLGQGERGLLVSVLDVEIGLAAVEVVRTRGRLDDAGGTRAVWGWARLSAARSAVGLSKSRPNKALAHRSSNRTVNEISVAATRPFTRASWRATACQMQLSAALPSRRWSAAAINLRATIPGSDSVAESALVERNVPIVDVSPGYWVRATRPPLSRSAWWRERGEEHENWPAAFIAASESPAGLPGCSGLSRGFLRDLDALHLRPVAGGDKATSRWEPPSRGGSVGTSDNRKRPSSRHGGWRAHPRWGYVNVRLRPVR